MDVIRAGNAPGYSYFQLTILKPSIMIAIQSMEKKEYLMRIAEKVIPGLAAGRFFVMVCGEERYYAGLCAKEEQPVYRSFYDEFDFAFSIRCTFSLCDVKTNGRWVRLQGNSHIYTSPILFVVDREEFNFIPDHAAERMHSRYRANTLVVDSYDCPGYSMQQLARAMKANGLNFILKKELKKAPDATRNSGASSHAVVESY
jgi:hypothetical protein